MFRTVSICCCAVLMLLAPAAPTLAQNGTEEAYTAQDAGTGPVRTTGPAKIRKPVDRAPSAAAGTSFVRVDSGCLDGGHRMRLSWRMEPGHRDTRVVISLRIPGDRSLRLDGLGPEGERSLALTPAGTGRAMLDVSFIDDRSRASARARLSLPYPDTGAASVEAEAREARLHGTLKAEITDCPATTTPIGAGRTPEDAERIARESETLERREHDALAARQGPMIFGHGSAGTSGRSAFAGPGGLSSNEPPFDPAEMATCIEREMYDRKAMGYGYAIVVNKQIFARSIGEDGWARSPLEDEAGSIGFVSTTPAHVASVSKPITAMAIMKLVQDGDLSLDEAFYPLVQSEYPQAGSGVDQITIRELLQHDSGLMPNYCGKTADSIAADADNGPGYSNINFCVLREVVEHVSGQSYVDYVQEAILAPSDIGGMSCAPGNANPTLYYTDADDPAGAGFNDFTDRCGSYGWYASAVDLGQIMAHYRNHTALSQQIAAQMRNDCRSNTCLGFIHFTTTEGTAWGHSGLWRDGGGNGSRAGIARLPRGVDAAIVMNSPVGKSGASILRDAYEQALDGGCLAPPEPPGPPSCPDTGCGTAINGLCAMAGDFPDGTQTADGFFIRQNHPDGAAAYNLYCEDHPEVLNYKPDAPAAELVCARANLSSGGPYNVCKGCGVDGKYWPGCECDPDRADSCGAGLTCFGASGYGNGSTSFSSGKCWSETAGPPIWECESDCTAIYGGTGYCHHGALPWEAGGTPICASAMCALGGQQCAEQGLFCNADTGDCEVECNGAVHNPGNGLFSCQGRGYGAEFACNLDSQRCFIGGVAHP